MSSFNSVSYRPPTPYSPGRQKAPAQSPHTNRYNELNTSSSEDSDASDERLSLLAKIITLAKTISSDTKLKVEISTVCNSTPKNWVKVPSDLFNYLKDQNDFKTQELSFRALRTMRIDPKIETHAYSFMISKYFENHLLSKAEALFNEMKVKDILDQATFRSMVNGYLTNRLHDEALSFIENNHTNPDFEFSPSFYAKFKKYIEQKQAERQKTTLIQFGSRLLNLKFTPDNTSFKNNFDCDNYSFILSTVFINLINNEHLESAFILIHNKHNPKYLFKKFQPYYDTVFKKFSAAIEPKISLLPSIAPLTLPLPEAKNPLLELEEELKSLLIIGDIETAAKWIEEKPFLNAHILNLNTQPRCKLTIGSKYPAIMKTLVFNRLNSPLKSNELLDIEIPGWKEELFRAEFIIREVLEQYYPELTCLHLLGTNAIKISRLGNFKSWSQSIPSLLTPPQSKKVSSISLFPQNPQMPDSTVKPQQLQHQPSTSNALRALQNLFFTH